MVTEHPSRLSDEALVAAVAARDREAFLALYDRYAPRMLGLILTVVRDRDAADDVLQRAMLEVWERHAGRYQAVLGSVEGWLLRLARSRAIDQVRSSGRRRAVDVDEMRESLADTSASARGLDESERRALLKAVRDLPEDERVPVTLAYMHGLTREEIAGQMGVPVGTVKTRIRRGVLRLRESMAGAGASGGVGGGGV